MAGKQSSAVDSALKVYRKGDSIYKLAKQFRLSHTTIYRALKRNGKRKGLTSGA